MAANLCKIIVLLIPATLTVGLLSFCLISDWWISVDEIKLNSFKKIQDNAFEAYLLGQEPAETTTLSSMTTTTATSEPLTNQKAKKTNNKLLQDDFVDDYNTYDENSNQTYEENDEDYKKLKKRQTSTVKDYVYVTKLWPLTKSKSLFSECIRYEKLTLRLSMAYLNQSNKEPIIGTIHYGDLMNNSSENEQCKGKMGMISCLLNNECVQGAICDGIVDCDDNSDEQFCDSSKVCHTNNGFQCDNKCWQYWNKCDQVPHCMNLSDELSNQCVLINEEKSSTRSILTSNSFIFGQNQYDYRQKCFRNYFNFKSPKLVEKESLKYLTQTFTDKLQSANIMNYHLHLIYAMALLFAFVFSVLALLSLLFMVCLQKSCIQCPFWFYGFFEILTWLACSFGLMTFLGQKAYANNPVNYPFEREIYAQNKNFPDFQMVGVTFWIAVAANGISFLASIMSCVFCCRIPSTRHENKEYKIMQLPTYH